MSTTLDKGSQWNNIYKVCEDYDSNILYPVKLPFVISTINMHFPITKEKYLHGRKYKLTIKIENIFKTQNHMESYYVLKNSNVSKASLAVGPRHFADVTCLYSFCSPSPHNDDWNLAPLPTSQKRLSLVLVKEELRNKLGMNTQHGNEWTYVPKNFDLNVTPKR